MKYTVCLEEKYKSKILGAAKAFDLIVIDAQDYTAAEIRQLKAGGAKILSYLNVGAVESDRSYFSAAKKAGLLLGEYDNWPGEYWVAAQKAQWREIILGLATTLKAKGADGFWVDNLDILYTVEEEYKWKSAQITELYTNLQAILQGLHKEGYVMINGGDVFVSRAIRAKQSDTFDGVNQETVFSCIKDYDPPGKFGTQDKEEREYYQDYLAEVKMAEKDVCLLEYTKDATVISAAQSYCKAQGFTLCVSNTIELGGDIQVATKSGTRWDVLEAATKYDGSVTAHKDVIAKIKGLGHSMSASTAWCTETVVSIFADAGALGLIGGYAADAGSLKRHAQKLGIWHSGSSGILPGCPVIYKGSDGKPNHTELAVGHNTTISGNHNGKCDRRSWSGRKVDGWISPKYPDMGTMDNLQTTIAACDSMLGVYGTKATREKQLDSFGSANRKKVQDEINRVWADAGKVAFDMAVYIIAGHAGKGNYRKTRLKSFEPSAQARVEAIYALRGKSTDQAAQMVIDGQFGTGSVRELLLSFCGYDKAKVQNRVNEILKKKITEDPVQDPGDSIVELFAPRFWDNDQDKYYGDETAFIQYARDRKTIERTVLVDTGMTGSNGVKKLQEKGFKVIDALIFSHDHGDHYGLYKKMIETCTVRHVYMPDQTGVRKYQPTYAKRMDAIEKYCKGKGIPVTYLKKGDSFTVGRIRIDCIFQADASKLPEKDDHHFINNMSMALRITVGKWRALLCGDLSADGIKQMLAAGVDVTCDIFKFLWHSDRGAITRALAKALGAVVAYTQYHHNESSGNGRKATHNLLREAGALVVRAFEDGPISMLIDGDTLTVTAGPVKKTFRK